MHMGYFCVWNGLPERALVDRRSAVDLYTFNLQNIVLCSNKIGNGSMLVVSKASVKSLITCCAKEANNVPCPLIHYVLSFV
jgi:hypothetical protein